MRDPYILPFLPVMRVYISSSAKPSACLVISATDPIKSSTFASFAVVLSVLMTFIISSCIFWRPRPHNMILLDLMVGHTVTSGRQLIDRIVYLASLASDPRSVDVTLDKLRIITVKSSELSSDDFKTLQAIQSELEDHLVHKERLRSFTKASLRQNVERHFAA